MQHTGQAGEKKSYRVILLLVVGLAAFSSAMKELNQVRDLTMETSKLVAAWSDVFAPADKNAMLVKVETCESSQIPAPPPPPVITVQPVAAPEVEEVVVPAVTPPPPTPPRVAPPAKPRRAVPPAHDSAEVRVFTTDEFIEQNIKGAFESDSALKALKAKNRRHIFVTPDGDVILKTLSRSINLRSAS